MNTMTHDTGTPPRGNPLRWLVWGSATALLLLPAVAMQLKVDGVNWTAEDFVAMGLLLASACGAYEWMTRLSGDWVYRAAAGVAILASLLLAWANLAVGLVADGVNAYNLAFMGVLAVGVAGALLSRFQPAGLSRTLVAMAVVHALIVGTALATGIDRLGASASALWLAPWVMAAILFRMSATRQKV
jgi:hypothetical protein